MPTTRSMFQTRRAKRREGLVKTRRKFKSVGKEYSCLSKITRLAFEQCPKLKKLEHTVGKLFYTLSQRSLTVNRRKAPKRMRMNTFNNMELLSTYKVSAIKESKQKAFVALSLLKW
eukprot:TRINITY_DN7537_c0_g1_i5.p2 TRINITY_DN7537_c0_g1~~TRINITY_DN7537_c0_g1_i5.p2  ORF type:complete len:116 (+),score=11.53 TRINITY_DN7537_c0_g1_i5:308-655(+)